MTRNFTTATDDSVIELIRNARHRLAVIAPGVTTPVAEALASRMVDLSRLSLTIILDADAEVYRMGYGDAEALTIIRNASENAMFDLREQPGIRIGVIISDDETMVYAPVSRNIEAGSNSIKHPNAIMVGTSATESLAVASGTTPEPESLESDADDVSPSSQEIGLTAFETEKVKDMEADLEANPPRPFDLTRRLPVFVSEVQFVELRLKNALLSSKKIVFPRHFLKFEDIGLREHTESSLKIPINLFEELSVKFESHREDAIAVETGNGEVKKFETMKISESDLKRERKNIEQRFYYNWIGRGHIILRRDKKTFQEEVDRLIAMTSAYQDVLNPGLIRKRSIFARRS